MHRKAQNVSIVMDLVALVVVTHAKVIVMENVVILATDLAQVGVKTLVVTVARELVTNST